MGYRKENNVFIEWLIIDRAGEFNFRETYFHCSYTINMGLPVGPVVNNLPANARHGLDP